MPRPGDAIRAAGVTEPAQAIARAVIAGVPHFVDAGLAHDPAALADLGIPRSLGAGREDGSFLEEDELDKLGREFLGSDIFTGPQVGYSAGKNQQKCDDARMAQHENSILN